MSANDPGASVSQHLSGSELQPVDDIGLHTFKGTRDQIAAIRTGFRQAKLGFYPVNVRLSLPWQTDRVYVTIVFYRGPRPGRFPQHANHLRSLDPFAISFWQHVPAPILASLTPEQGNAIARALKPYRWQQHPWDWRGAFAWGDRRYAFAFVAGPERRSRERRLAERKKHPLWTSANAAFLLALQLPFLLTVGLGLGAVLSPQSFSALRARDLAYRQAIDAGLRDPIAREAYFTSDLPRLRDRLKALGVEATIRDRHPHPLTDREYEQLVVRTFHQRLTLDVSKR